MANDNFLAALQDPYLTGGDTYSGIGAGAVAGSLPYLVDPYGSTGSNALNVFGGSILAALLGNMAKSDAAEQNAGIVSQQSQFLKATPAERLTMTQQDPRTFAKLQAALNTNQILQEQKNADYLSQLETQKGFEIDKENRALENQIKLQTDPRIIAFKNQDALDPAKRLVKEGETIAKLDQVNKYIDEKFDRAKQLTGAKTAAAMNLGYPNANASELTGLKDSVLVQIDNALGREMNSDVRERLLSLTPTSYDSDAVIETKKQNMKDLLISLSNPTPLTNSILTGVKQPESPPAPPAGYELTGKKDANGNYGIRKIR
jgi:hypothetical protein